VAENGLWPAEQWLPYWPRPLLTRGDHPEPDVDANGDVSAQPIEE
jgi:hypothetical protein